MTEIDRDRLRHEKLAEFRTELTRILETGKKFGISAADIVQLIRQIQED